MADISLGTLYDANKELMKKQKTLSSKQIDDSLSEIKELINQWENNYIMLLSNEKHDYTVFHINNSLGRSKAIKELKGVLLNRGKVLDISIAVDDSSCEMWIKHNDDNEPVVYYLFPYDFGVIEC